MNTERRCLPRRVNHRRSTALLTVCILLLYEPVFSGTTGKIAGRITDAETGNGLSGVNLVIEGTSTGVATDENGYYVILNVAPGTHTLKASMMGYADMTATNVIVAIDLTTTVDMEMTPKVLGMEEVTVVAKRPLVVKDVSASQFNVIVKAMETMPILDITEVIGLHAGIQGLTIRGGSSRQTAFIMDGFILNDERSNYPYSSITLSSINEIQLQTGGFNAEYGNIRSGVINVITKEGRRDRYGGSFTLQYVPPGPKHFGPSVYDPNTYFTRPFLDPAVCWTGTANSEPYEDLNSNGVWDEDEPFTDFNGDGTLTVWDDYTQRQYPSFEGWNAVSEATLQDNDPSNDLTPEGAKRLFEWQHRRQGDIVEPDYIMDLGLGGPVPVIGERLGNLRFYASYRDAKEMFILPLSRDSYRDNVASVKLTADVGLTMRLSFTGMYGEIHSVSPYNWKTTPTGRVLRTPYEIANLVSSSSGNSIIYMPGWFSPSSIYRTIWGIKLNRILTPRTYYDVSVQQNINRYNTYKMADRDTTKDNEVVNGYYVDDAPFGYWGYGVTAIDGMGMGGWMNLGRDKSVNSTTSLRLDLTSQVNNTNQVKMGFYITLNDYDIKSFTSNPSMETWNRRQVYEVHPYRIEAYAQDKLEFEGFIANIGIRLEFSDANSPRYNLQDYDQYYKEGNGDLIEKEAARSRAEPLWSVSPRLGVSHPITENSKLYFNYGHFREEPSSTYRFRIQREYNGLVTSIGEPNLKREKTVAYELGYSHSLFNRFLLNLAAYYKDVTNQIGWIYYQNINNSVQYNRPDNNNYEDIRGLEITLQKGVGTWVTGFFNYTYMVQTSGYFGYTNYYEDPNKQREYLRQNPYQEKPRPRPYLRTNIDLHTPIRFGPKLIGRYPLGGWNINVLGTWSAGAYTTYNPNNEPGVLDNVQWKDRYNVDLRLTKSMRLGGTQIQMFLDVTNLLNAKFLSYAGFSDNFDYLDYMESLHFSWEEGIEHGDDRIGEYRDGNVEYVPMQSVSSIEVVETPESRVLYYDQSTTRYMQYSDEGWVERDKSWVQKEVVDRKAYIDMPNLSYFTFLNPPEIKFGVRASF